MKVTVPVRTLWCLALASVWLAACTQLEQPAQQAIAGVESAINAAAAQAGKYIPEQLAAVQAKLDGLKGDFAKKDYQEVISKAPSVLTEAQGLVAAAAAKKDEVAKAAAEEWTALTSSVPALIALVENRGNALLKQTKLPAGLNLDEARIRIADAKAMWMQALAAGTRGSVENAVATARKVKQRLETVAQSMELKLPQL